MIGSFFAKIAFTSVVILTIQSVSQANCESSSAKIGLNYPEDYHKFYFHTEAKYESELDLSLVAPVHKSEDFLFLKLKHKSSLISKLIKQEGRFQSVDIKHNVETCNLLNLSPRIIKSVNKNKEQLLDTRYSEEILEDEYVFLRINLCPWMRKENFHYLIYSNGSFHLPQKKIFKKVKNKSNDIKNLLDSAKMKWPKDSYATEVHWPSFQVTDSFETDFGSDGFKIWIGKVRSTFSLPTDLNQPDLNKNQIQLDVPWMIYQKGLKSNLSLFAHGTTEGCTAYYLGPDYKKASFKAIEPQGYFDLDNNKTIDGFMMSGNTYLFNEENVIVIQDN